MKKIKSPNIKKITLLFITHNKQKEVIDYLLTIIDRLPLKKIDILLISDNLSSLNLPKKLIGKVNFLMNENIGKLRSILLHCDEIKTKYFKVIDHDDCLDYNLLEKFVDDIRSDDDFIYHKASIIYKGNKNYGKVTSDNNLLNEMRNDGEDVFWKKIPNAQAIFNTSTIKLLSKVKNIHEQKYFNDDLLTLSCQFLSTKSRKIDVPFYHQFHNLGQTSTITSEKYTSLLNLFKNLNKFSKAGNFSWLGNYTDFDMLIQSTKYQYKINNSAIDIKSNTKIKRINKEMNKLNNNINNKNKLTLLIVMHNGFERISFFLDLLKNSKNDMIFVFDNPISEVYNNLLKSRGIRFYINDKNGGKINAILNSVKYIGTSYFKIIDQDDSISLLHLSKLNKEINKLNGNYLIKHKAFKLDRESNLNFQTLNKSIIKKQISMSKDVKYSVQTNCDTIYSTSTIAKISQLKNLIYRQEFHNDILLSNLALALGDKLKRVKNGFYIQFHEHGQTSSFNIERLRCVEELYKNYEIIMDNSNNFEFKKMYNNNNNINNHLNFIKRFTIDYLDDSNESIDVYNRSINILNKL